MKDFDQNAFLNVDYNSTQQFYERLDLTGYGRIQSKGIYQDMLINFASYKKGVSEKNGKTSEWEIISLQLVDMHRKQVLNVGFNPVSNFARYCELVYLTGVKDSSGKPGLQVKTIQTNNGEMNIIEDLLGKKIDIAVDRPVQKNGGYVDLRVRAFFLNGFSARETLNHNVQEPTDIRTVFKTLEDGPVSPFNGQQSSPWMQQTQPQQSQPQNWGGYRQDWDGQSQQEKMPSFDDPDVLF